MGKIRLLVGAAITVTVIVVVFMAICSPRRVELSVPSQHNTIDIKYNIYDNPITNSGSTIVNSTHVGDRIMEPVDAYAENIYFSVKTMNKYHDIRLPILMLTWLQAVKNKVSVVCCRNFGLSVSHIIKFQLFCLVRN